MGKPILAYWDLRGLAEPIRYLLHYKNVQFEDKRYQRDGTWEKEKFTFDLDFPNLPYYMDDKVKLTQSTTILRYLAKKFDLEGKSEEERLRVSLAEQQILDFRLAFFMTIASPDFEKKKEEYLKKVPDSLKLISNFLGNRKFLAGDNVTYVDFMAYDVFEFNVFLSKTILDGFPILKAYQERIRNLPELKSYFSSITYKKWPIVGPRAVWGHSGEMPQ
ncbi:glutathione S-transferase class-mu 26 kDa isozyme 47 [Parasteatoda tepidariorum]|uniref:glutathione S-transferase class-mu 26 kDa isozyme 47 n=1 Tax=Parasteatoda tepidariorum TaxID=114398 RepID=UPI001C727615|nr:glutathione S-transferase class-mu 26 kDa isozyme 47 [Parasteatoda tepidariorum]